MQHIRKVYIVYRERLLWCSKTCANDWAAFWGGEVLMVNMLGGVAVCVCDDAWFGFSAIINQGTSCAVFRCEAAIL